MTTPDPYCERLASPNPWTLALSIFLVLGILFSYLPQHAKIIQNASSAGLSPWWVLLGTLSSVSAIANIVVLPTTQHDLACCRQISGAACGAALLGVIQIGVQWLCFMTIMLLFLIYFPRNTTPTPTLDVPRNKDAITVALTSLTSLLLVLLTSLIFLILYPSYLLAWANILGVMASILSCIQYIPQLFTTWKIKKVLSLSITTMVIQVPGSFLFAFSLWLRVGWQGWSTWCVYCVTGVLQATLLGMAIVFSRREAEGGKDGVGEGDGEREPLLGDRENTRT